MRQLNYEGWRPLRAQLCELRLEQWTGRLAGGWLGGVGARRHRVAEAAQVVGSQ